MSRIFNARLTARVEAAGMRGLMAAAQRIFEESQALVPVDEGDTKRSGYVEQVDDRTVEIGYRDAKAAALHENLTATHRGGTGAKFLERPLTADQATVADTVARQITVETR